MRSEEPCEFLEISREAILQRFNQRPDSTFSLIQDVVTPIRDRTLLAKDFALTASGARIVAAPPSVATRDSAAQATEVSVTIKPVSYTHLTLPTICSV